MSNFTQPCFIRINDDTVINVNHVTDAYLNFTVEDTNEYGDSTLTEVTCVVLVMSVVEGSFGQAYRDSGEWNVRRLRFFGPDAAALRAYFALNSQPIRHLAPPEVQS